MDAKHTLIRYKQKIDTALASFFDKKISQAGIIDSSAVELMKNLKEFNLRGGKRIRPTLMIHTFKCFKEPKENDLIFASLALELMEGFFLIHDDVLDHDDLRRGGSTFHKTYEKKYSDKHFGEGMAIVAGDIQNSLANEVISRSHFSSEIINSFLCAYHEAAFRTEYGWLAESMLTKKPVSEITEGDVMKVNRLKTASYTVEGPLQIGAILAGASEEDKKKLNDFAVPLGIAFQIQDDILGMFGDEAKLGKPIGSDLKEGKITLLIVKALEKADKKQKAIITDSLGKQDLSLNEVETVRKAIKETGSLDHSKKLAEDLINKAKNALRDADLKPEGKDFLLGIADFMVKREY